MTEITQALQTCKQQVADSLQHTNPLLNRVLSIVRVRTGKMMRPQLVLLSARLFGPITPSVISVAAAYESFHTATLIHDDVVDESEERRGQESLNHAQNNRVAILVGDYILGVALRTISSVREPRLIDIMARSAQDLTDGELLQLYNIQNNIVSEDTYYDIIRKKTATLFSACAESGAFVGKASQSDIETFRRFGEMVGICFQIKDDIFDYEHHDIGKPLGNDMKEGKLTLPIIYALQHTSHQLEPLITRVKQCMATPDEIATLIRFAHENGGIDYAIRQMNRYADQAHQLLSAYPDSATTQALHQFVDKVIDRDH